LAIFGGSFRSVAKTLIPVAVLLILSACGGSGGSTVEATREVRGDGFTVHVPGAWAVSGAGGGKVTARNGDRLVSVTSFRLLKPYDPGKFAAAAKELDGIAAKLAAQAGGNLTEKTTTTVDGRRVRAYRYADGASRIHVGFVLVGRREYQLVCRLPSDGADPDGACALLFDSFRSS
jgi:hypothetical protein